MFWYRLHFCVAFLRKQFHQVGPSLTYKHNCFRGFFSPFVLFHVMLSTLQRTELSWSSHADSPCGGWWLWCWRVAYGAWGREVAAEGPAVSSLLWLGSPSASEWAFLWGRSHRLWDVAPCQPGSDAWMGGSPQPKPQPCTGRGSADASSPRQQL